MIIEEGNEFNFLVEKIIDLSDESYFILLSEFDKQYLLPTKYYDEYNIKVGNEIRCRIDRINCSGRVFLEPKSPIYSIGDKDIFTLLDVKQKETRKTKDKYLVIKAKSSKTNRAIVVNYSRCLDYSLNENYLCEVIKIKKAEMQLKLISKV
ncbi:MAG: hypothetical protein HY951_12355 [Bacteroidia bacterium]|nr:hypothetical protein [Bacteroidia bacterium]